MPTLFLVRHAEPELQGVLLGRLDPPLSAAGKVHAAAIVLPESVRALYSSPLRRALETAQEMARDVPVAVLDDLMEIGYGAWDGLTWSAIEAKDPETARRKQADWIAVTPPGGEAWSDFRDRVRRAAEVIRKGPFPASVVAHAAVNAVLAELLTGADPLIFQQKYGEVVGLACDL